MCVRTAGPGIGRELVADLLARAARSGKHVMIAGIDADNAASIGLHRSLGFTEVGHFHEVGFKFGRWLDLTFMQCILPPTVDPSRSKEKLPPFAQKRHCDTERTLRSICDLCWYRSLVIMRRGKSYTDRHRGSRSSIARRRTGVFPTETVYGLGANAADPAAVRKIFEVKGRPPIIR